MGDDEHQKQRGLDEIYVSDDIVLPMPHHSHVNTTVITFTNDLMIYLEQREKRKKRKRETSAHYVKLTQKWFYKSSNNETTKDEIAYYLYIYSIPFSVCIRKK